MLETNTETQKLPSSYSTEVQVFRINFEPENVRAQLRDMVLRAAARSNLPIRWLPDRLAEQNFAMGEPPSKASPWVRVLMGHLQSLRQRLDAQAGLTPADVTEVRLLAIAE